MRDLATNLEVREHYAGAYTTTQTPTNGVSVAGLINPMVYAHVGAMTQGTWALTLQHSDTIDSGYAAVADTDVVLGPGCDTLSSGVFKTVGTATDETAYRVSYIGTKAFVRLVATAAGTPGSTAIAAAVLGEPVLKPAAS